MKTLHLTKSIRTQSPLVVLAVVATIVCLGLSSFVINPPSVLADDSNRISYRQFMEDYQLGNAESVLMLGEYLMGHEIWHPHDEEDGLSYAANSSDLPAYAEKLRAHFEQLGKDRERSAEITRIIRQRMREQQQQATTETTDNSETQPESETTSSTPGNYKSPPSLPLITSRSLPAPASARPEPTEEPDVQAEPEAAPQPDQNRPAETDSGNIDSVDEPQAPEAALSPPSEATTAILLDVASANQSASQFGDPTQASSGTSGNTRAVLWGIVASMSTLLALGSLIFRQKDQE